MLIRKNTKAFKSILEIIIACHNRPDRQKLVRLYITKAGHSIKDRINVEGIEGDTALFYELTYDAVRNNLTSSDRQLHQSDDVPGIYFFQTNSNKAWDETPFEFDESIKKEFGSLPDAPILRKKDKVEKFALPVSTVKSRPTEKPREPAKKTKIIEKVLAQPNYKLGHKIQFTDLDTLVFRKPPFSKKDVLDYYYKIADTMLPYVKDRPLAVRMLLKGREKEISTLHELAENVEVPEWVKSAAHSKSKPPADFLLCNDKDHLLWYAEKGAVEFRCGHSRVMSPDFADYILLVIESPSADPEKAIAVALSAKVILSGLQIKSFIKTDGRSTLHIYLPLAARIRFDTAKAVAEYISKLVRIKVSDLISLEGSEDDSYGKVSLSFLVNEAGKKVVAPYSLVLGEAPAVATPLTWEMVQPGLRFQDVDAAAIQNIVKAAGDPFEDLFEEKTNAVAVLARLEANYSFLF